MFDILWQIAVKSTGYKYFIYFYIFQVGLDDRMLIVVGSIASVSNGLSRGVFAALVDRFGLKIVYMGIQVSNFVVTAVIGM